MVSLLSVLAFTLLPFAALSGLINRNVDRRVVTERDLRRDIFAEYDKLVRPVKDPSHAVPLAVSISLLALQELDEDKQVIILDSMMVLRWNDEYLTWDPTNYNNISHLNIPASELWKPDLFLYSAYDDKSFKPPSITQAIVYNNGSVMWVPPFTIKSRCPVPFNKTPKETIKCDMYFGSWTFSGLQLDIQLFGSGADTSYFLDNNVNWKLLKAATSREDKYYPCCVESYPLIHFNVTMKRRFRGSSGLV